MAWNKNIVVCVCACVRALMLCVSTCRGAYAVPPTLVLAVEETYSNFAYFCLKSQPGALSKILPYQYVFPYLLGVSVVRAFIKQCFNCTYAYLFSLVDCKFHFLFLGHWGQIDRCSNPSHVILDKLLNLFEFHFPYLKNGDNYTYLIGLL